MPAEAVAKQFYDRHFPVRPDLEQLWHQAKDRLRDLRQGAPPAIELWHRHHPQVTPVTEAELADAQFLPARMPGLDPQKASLHPR